MGGLRVDGVTINVSEHGVCLFAATNLSVGTEIEIVYRPPGRKTSVCAHGIVRRRAVFLYGIEFLNNDAAAIEDHIHIFEELALSVARLGKFTAGENFGQAVACVATVRLRISRRATRADQ
jgi:hypothetical protein